MPSVQEVKFNGDYVAFALRRKFVINLAHGLFSQDQTDKISSESDDIPVRGQAAKCSRL